MRLHAYDRLFGALLDLGRTLAEHRTAVLIAHSGRPQQTLTKEDIENPVVVSHEEAEELLYDLEHCDDLLDSGVQSLAVTEQAHPVTIMLFTASTGLIVSMIGGVSTVLYMLTQTMATGTASVPFLE